jgi:hypothetical protein
LEHFKKLQGNLEFYQNKCHSRGVLDTRRQCPKAADLCSRGWPPGPTLQPLSGWLRGDTLQEAILGNPMLKVGGAWTPWLVGHHLVCYRLNQVGNPSMDPYISPTGANQSNTHYL